MAAVREQLEWESALVRRASKGDRYSFERLYRAHVDRVYGVCVRLTGDVARAEDCTQETFVKAWRSLSRFETRSSFGTWLHRIAVNVVLNSRRRRSEREPQWADLKGQPAPPAGSDGLFDTPVEVDEIERAIASLPQGARDVLVLCGIYGYSHAEVAAMLGVAEGTCKAQLHRARTLLRQRLELENRI
jgi:RNA polymerase sigma-70 factor, ECF subfamily